MKAGQEATHRSLQLSSDSDSALSQTKKSETFLTYSLFTSRRFGCQRKIAKIPFFIALIVSKTAQYMFSLKINLITIDRIRDNY